MNNTDNPSLRTITGTSTEAARNDDSAPRAVRLKVSDNGGGFSEKVLKRAFEPYVTTKTKGTGLGLAVVKKIADEHGARVRIVNRQAPTDAQLGTGTEGAIIGAQVSLSFSRFAPASAAPVPSMPASASTPNPAPPPAPAAAPGQ